MTTELTADPELDPIKDVPISTAHGIAAVALHMALKYHDSTLVKDGALYQQYKLQGVNMRELDLNTVFETAIKIERHLLAGSERIASMVVDALEIAVEQDEKNKEDVPKDE